MDLVALSELLSKPGLPISIKPTSSLPMTVVLTALSSAFAHLSRTDGWIWSECWFLLECGREIVMVAVFGVLISLADEEREELHVRVEYRE